MTLEECAQVLTKIQLGDNRQADRLVLAEWFDTIGHLDFGDAVGAVKLHRQESTDYLMPAHVIAGARRLADERARDLRRGRQVQLPGWIVAANERAELRALGRAHEAS